MNVAVDNAVCVFKNFLSLVSEDYFYVCTGFFDNIRIVSYIVNTCELMLVLAE